MMKIKEKRFEGLDTPSSLLGNGWIPLFPNSYIRGTGFWEMKVLQEFCSIEELDKTYPIPKEHILNPAWDKGWDTFRGKEYYDLSLREQGEIRAKYHNKMKEEGIEQRISTDIPCLEELYVDDNGNFPKVLSTLAHEIWDREKTVFVGEFSGNKYEAIRK